MIARLALLLCLTLPAAAQDAPDAVLRIGRATDAPGCTAFLVAPDAALTAGHCARRLPVRLHAGWRDGRIARSRLAEDPRRPAPPADGTTRQADQARLRLLAPFPGVTPLETGPPPAPGSTVTIPAYPRHAPARETATCRVLARSGPEILLDCPARTGMSGAPLLQGGRAVGILTHRVGPDRSLGTAIAPDLLD